MKCVIGCSISKIHLASDTLNYYNEILYGKSAILIDNLKKSLNYLTDLIKAIHSANYNCDYLYIKYETVESSNELLEGQDLIRILKSIYFAYELNHKLDEMLKRGTFRLPPVLEYSAHEFIWEIMQNGSLIFSSDGANRSIPMYQAINNIEMRLKSELIQAKNTVGLDSKYIFTPPSFDTNVKNISEIYSDNIVNQIAPEPSSTQSMKSNCKLKRIIIASKSAIWLTYISAIALGGYLSYKKLCSHIFGKILSGNLTSIFTVAGITTSIVVFTIILAVSSQKLLRAKENLKSTILTINKTKGFDRNPQDYVEDLRNNWIKILDSIANKETEKSNAILQNQSAIFSPVSEDESYKTWDV